MKSNRPDSTAPDPPDISRRSLLELAGLAITAAAFPSSAASALPPAHQAKTSQGTSSVMNALSTYMSEAAKHPLSDEVTEKTKHHILDTLAAMISGSNLLPGQRALQFARAYGGREISTVVASNTLCGPVEPLSLTACLLMLMKPMIPTPLPSHTRVAQLFPLPLPLASNLASAEHISFAPWRSAMTLALASP